MDEIGMFTALRPQPGPLDLSGAHGRLASAITGTPDRRRVSRRTRYAAAGGLAAAAAAAVTAATLTAGSAPPALATVTTALTRTLTQSYHLTEQTSTYYISNGRTRHSVHITCTSVTDPARHLEASSCSNGLAYREVGGYTYFYFANPVGHPGRHWERIPGAVQPAATPGAIDTLTPQQMLSAIEKADKVTVVGPASGPGWTGTRYAFSNSAGRTTTSGTVDVDRQGRARALALTNRLTGAASVLVRTQVLTFSDFGARVTVTPPPADQTFPWS